MFDFFIRPKDQNKDRNLVSNKAERLFFFKSQQNLIRMRIIENFEKKLRNSTIPNGSKIARIHNNNAR